MIRVASYCRVSTDQEDQVNSLEAQQRYFREYIAHHPDWELYKVYADEGITGTSTNKRMQFNRMIRDAYEGRFALILTKEVSRFSRNILDTIAYTRELKSIGVGVRFMIDGINTLEPDAELYLSMMASMAQEESRRTSARVTWGQTRQMERGVVFGTSMLGYDVKAGRLTVNPEGAALVRLIFQKYAVEQIGTAEIARYLKAKGFQTYKGSTNWRSGTVVKILKNEKYVGDLVQKKTYTPDYLSHARRENKGEVPLIRMENHHEPIVSRELWDRTQERLRQNNKREDGTHGHSNRYVFSGKIKCGVCGRSFVGRFRYRENGTKSRRWRCGTAAAEGATACSVGKLVRDDDAMQMLKTAIRSLSLDRSTVIRNVAVLALEALRLGEPDAADEPERLRNEIDRNRRKTEAMMDSYFSGDLSREEMLAMKQRYEQQRKAWEERLEKAEERQNIVETMPRLEADLQSEVDAILCGEIESEIFYKTMLDSLTVLPDRKMELRLMHLAQVFRFAE